MCSGRQSAPLPEILQHTVAILVEGNARTELHEFLDHLAPCLLYSAYVLVAHALEAHVNVVDGDKHNGASGDEDDDTKLEMQCLPPVAGRALGTICRFNLNTMFSDRSR